MGSLARAAEHQQGLEFSQRNLCCFRLRLTGIHPERESGTAWRLRQEQKNPSWPVCQSIGKNGVFGMRTALSNYAMRVANGVVGVVAAAVVHAVSPNRAHEVFWRISQAAFPLFAGVYRVFRPQSRSELWRIHVLQRALSVMTRRRPGFTLKVRVSGTDEIEGALHAGDPLIICTAHFGLTLAAARVLADLGHRPAWIVDRTDTADGWHWGLRQPLWILPRASDVMRTRDARCRTDSPSCAMSISSRLNFVREHSLTCTFRRMSFGLRTAWPPICCSWHRALKPTARSGSNFVSRISVGSEASRRRISAQPNSLNSSRRERVGLARFESPTIGAAAFLLQCSFNCRRVAPGSSPRRQESQRGRTRLYLNHAVWG
jgi:hypothetical protein